MPLRLDVAKMRELRKALKLTQAEAAERAGMTQTRWNDVEAGGRSNVTIDTLGNIADALSCEPATLLVKELARRKKK
jgi:transcriptional regulator with XRE-family HTH domain